VRRRWLRGCILAGALVWASASFAPRSFAQDTAPGSNADTSLAPSSSNSPVLITADQVTYDRDLGVAVASGHVEVSQDNRVLKSDTLTYNERQKTVTASGNVALLDESGNVAFSDYMVVTDDLKNAIIRDIRLLLADKSRMAAVTARRTGPIDQLDKVVYSPCQPCVANPMSPPAWQLRARTAVHDNVEHTITYRDAWMEVFGVPVFYTPYFSQPDSTVKRKSGFLAPRIATSGQLGLQVQVPYYWVIDPQSDLTLDPIIATQVYPVLSGQYRRRVENGQFSIAGSATVGDIDSTDSNGVTTTESDQLRGHVFAQGQFDITDNWRAGFDINRASDIDYLRLYGFPNNFARSLDSTVYAEGFDGRSYASAQAYAFQGLRSSDIQDQTPIVAPLINYSLVSEPGRGGAYWTIDANLMSLNRIDGTDSQRLSAKVGWVLPYTAPAGDIYKLGLSLRADGYLVNDVQPGSTNPSPSGPTESGFAGRIFPQLTFDWRYPFVRRSPGINQVFEPLFSASIATSSGNDSMIPNEDSLDFQFDETNLFSPDRFTGLDLVDNGQRISYGFKYSIYGDSGGHSSLMLGQSYQFNSDNAFLAGAGQNSQLSNIVGALDISPNGALDLLYRFQIQTHPFAFLRQELGLHAVVGPLDVGIDYAFLDGSINDGSTLGPQQEFNAFANLRINDNWSVQVEGRQDLESGNTLEYGGGVTWQNDCMNVSVLGTRSNYSTDQIEPDTRFLFVINFKNLAGTNLVF